MRTFIADIIPKIQRFSQRLDDLTKLTNQHWVSLGDISQTKRVFIFRANNQLLISANGIVEKGSWEYLGNQSLLLDTKAESYLLKHGFFDENVIALKLDSTDNYAFFVNETKYQGELNNIADVLNFLENKYLKNKSGVGGLGSIDKKQTLNPPQYQITGTNEKTTFFGSITQIYSIRFIDGSAGEVFYKPKIGKAYYKERKAGYWYSHMHYYQTLELCIEALYYFLKSGQRSEEGYIFTDT